MIDMKSEAVLYHGIVAGSKSSRMDEDHLTEIARGPLVILARSLAGTPSVHRRCMSIHCAGRSLQIEEAEQLVDQWFGQGVRSA